MEKSISQTRRTVYSGDIKFFQELKSMAIVNRAFRETDLRDRMKYSVPLAEKLNYMSGRK
tara:strand:- start:221 stop:400 length:180 start_codon:yes stop_codon:yes gene_type:complete